MSRINVSVREFLTGIPAHVKEKVLERSLYNPRNWRRFVKWWKSNVLPLESKALDLDAALDEIDKTMTFSEAVDHITAKYPGFFKNREKERIKQIVFIRALIPKLVSGEIKCTYRNRRMYGAYYVVTNRFRRDQPSLLIEITHNELIKRNKLTNSDAKLAGLRSAQELRLLLKKWYRNEGLIFRNWLTVKQVYC